MKRSISLNKFLIIFLVLLVLLDVTFRPKEFLEFSLKAVSFYLASIFLLFLFFRESLGLLNKIKSEYVFSPVLLLSSALFLFFVLGSYSFYRYFKILPNAFTFKYMLDEFDEFYFILLSGLTPFLILLFIIVLAAFFFTMRHFIKNKLVFNERGSTNIIVSIALILSIFLVLDNNIKNHPGSIQPAVNIVSSVKTAMADRLKGKGTHGRRSGKLSRPDRIIVNDTKRELGFNVLIILNECLRAVNSGTHGYERDTTPVQSKFLKENDGIVFSNFYAVSTRTILAVPTLLTGINPVQPGSYLLNYPMLSNYSKAFDNVSTFFISAHRFYWGNMLRFVDDGSWDHLYYKEVSDKSPKNKLAIEDVYISDEFERYIAGVKSNFVGIVHFRGTHQTYDSDEEDRRFDQKDTIGRYDNSVLTLDKNVGRVIDSLEKHKLLDNTVILVTSDHADALGEHGYSGHLYTFYEEEARVPGWLYIPKKMRADERFEKMHYVAAKNKDKNLSNIDIVPTILDLMDIWAGADFSDIKKNFLGNAITSDDIDIKRIVNFQNNNGANDENMFEGMGLKYLNYKYLLHSKFSGLVEEAYDVAKDPEEKNNIITSIDPELLEMFRGELKKYETSKALFKKYLEQNK